MTNNYWKFRMKLLGRMGIVILIVSLSFLLAVPLLIDGIFEDSFANFLVGIDHNLYYFALSHKGTILTGIFLIVLLVSLVIVVARFTKYIEQISGAVDHVFVENPDPIVLPSELRPMETKLNTIKNTLRQRQFEAKESERRKDDLVVYLAHDIKTPLTSIIGYLSLLEEQKDMPADQREKYVKVVKEKAYRLEGLVNELFDVTRFNAQHIELTTRKVNLNRMVRQLMEEFYPLLREHHLGCKLDIPEVNPVVADPDQLARVFDNLLRNAVHYSEPTSDIVVSMGQDAKYTYIQFSNYGTTIPADKLDRIFEKFYRLDESRSSENGGAGLGLAIAKRIVEQHGGTITAQSKDLWTTFCVILPNGWERVPTDSQEKNT
ncbi:HAMP domain-containing histidine kinase [[Clostridium] leptum]|nr:HAMP domain-containing histidine kinase [[Clostridium] leptum]